MLITLSQRNCIPKFVDTEFTVTRMALFSLIVLAKKACIDQKLVGNPPASLCTRSGRVRVSNKSKLVMASGQQLLPTKLMGDKL